MAAGGLASLQGSMSSALPRGCALVPVLGPHHSLGRRRTVIPLIHTDLGRRDSSDAFPGARSAPWRSWASISWPVGHFRPRSGAGQPIPSGDPEDTVLCVVLCGHDALRGLHGLGWTGQGLMGRVATPVGGFGVPPCGSRSWLLAGAPRLGPHAHGASDQRRWRERR